MMPNKDPHYWLSGLFFLSIAAALLGRLAWLGERSCQGRRFWTWRLLFELPTAFIMALIGHGIAEYFEQGNMASLGLISVLSYLGPRGFIDEIERIAHLKGGKNDKRQSND